MCFKKPKPPPVTTAADPELYAQRIQAEQDNAIIKAENKRIRTEDQLALLSGRIGRKSLFSGGQGGRGFPGMRSLFGNSGAYQPGHRPIVPITPVPTGPGPGGGGGRNPTGDGPMGGSGGGMGRPGAGGNFGGANPGGGGAYKTARYSLIGGK